ncbi:hypothetical protein [Schleiferilactobacillus perolens]|jgi:hypothetical protein|uniref:hypothetical protein n=1 Tax=Schleiferilactobacillus perolens TaxID=100468 RepID=UPI002353D88D|nr:hypothetical protein [Schleiferilactobacillus perolens]MCI2170094.1 hypothetical protein [Schleiferilactobacillus perolens]
MFQQYVPFEVRDQFAPLWHQFVQSDEYAELVNGNDDQSIFSTNLLQFFNQIIQIAGPSPQHWGGDAIRHSLSILFQGAGTEDLLTATDILPPFFSWLTRIGDLKMSENSASLIVLSSALKLLDPSWGTLTEVNPTMIYPQLRK